MIYATHCSGLNKGKKRKKQSNKGKKKIQTDKQLEELPAICVSVLYPPRLHLQNLPFLFTSAALCTNMSLSVHVASLSPEQEASPVWMQPATASQR